MKNNSVKIVNNQENVCNIDCLGQFKATCKLTNSAVVSLQYCILRVME